MAKSGTRDFPHIGNVGYLPRPLMAGRHGQPHVNHLERQAAPAGPRRWRRVDEAACREPGGGSRSPWEVGVQPAAVRRDGPDDL